VRYACPDCKTALIRLWCPKCQAEFPVRGGLPVLVPRGVHVGLVESAAKAYDRMYSHGSNIWNDQGRTPALIRFLADRLAELSKGSVLEIGCGEGFLLEAIDAVVKVGVDPSLRGLTRAVTRTQASLALAVAENLPFPSETFDLVVSVGVMEHFFDDNKASREVARVLKRDGWYLTLVHTQRTVGQRLSQKFSEYLFPRMRPHAAARWLLRSIFRPRVQPIQNNYTVESAMACIENAGLQVKEVLSLRSSPKPPFVGPHVVVYVARKSVIV
jgi:SAM-dependent methyltransferase